MQSRLLTETVRCVGCRLCEMACSLKHESEFAPWLSRIKVDRTPRTCLAVPSVCRHCADAPCVAACPVDAIKQSPASDVVYIDAVECIGCQQCLDACPYHCIVFDSSRGVALKCDLCNGDPVCARVCPSGAVAFAVSEDGE
ncbi:MAG: 4Fe-4S dicluster domain-containing protein [Firmicutes bacterium]|nr:4Fe-4S dicluster domain-containing protein [Bacillota bacterium]